MYLRLRVGSERTEGTGSARYQPGIDGLRAVAVLGVLLFHAEVGVHGGFLGVSLFFTLSGYLITTLLLEEISATKRVDVRRFLVRRVRRLAPASYVVLALIALCAPLFAAAGEPIKLRGDLIAALGYVANWRFVVSEQSYADLFIGGPSPVLHYWSLAVEEQFYLIYPLVMAGAAWAARWYRRRWIPLAVVCALLLASVAAGLLTNDLELGYYGVHVRAAELLVGAVAAFIVGHIGLSRLAAHPRPWVYLGGLGLLMFAVLTVTARRTAGWVLGGGLTAASVAWSVVVVGCMVPGVLSRALSTPVLVHLGRLSFGLYLYHWPVYLVIDSDLLGMGGWMLFAIRLAVTLGLAQLSFMLIEDPIRARRLALRTWRFGVAYLVVVAVTLAAAGLHLRPRPPTTFDAMLHPSQDVVIFDPAPAPAPAPAIVVVVGSDTEVLSRVQQLADAVGSEVVDLVDPGCSQFAELVGCARPDERLRQYLVGKAPPAAVVIAIGSLDHRAVDDRLEAAERVSSETLYKEMALLERISEYIGAVSDAVPELETVQVVDAAQGRGAPDALAGWVTAEVLQRPGSELRTLDELTTSMMTEAATAIDGQQPRVMLIGDSTSYGVALSLDALAGDRFELLWAGYRNCPMVQTAAVRWWAEAEFTMEDCVARQQEWPVLISEFKPDVLLVVLGLPEHSEQRYPGDETWYHVGDERFTIEHEAALQRLLESTSPLGTELLFTDSQRSGNPTRIDAWNSLLASWAARWTRVSVIPYGAAAEQAEAAAGRLLRPDGIHFDDATLLSLVRDVILPAIDAALSRSSR